MKKRLLILYTLLIALLIIACSPNEPTEPVIEDDKANVDIEVEQEPTEPTIPMSDFFPNEHTTLHFKGEGNEFAELEVEILHIDNQYVVQREDNGGAYVQAFYKINEKNIEIIKDKHIVTKKALPTVNELNLLPPIGIYLQQPFEKGATFENWTITEIDAVVETPYQTFDNAIVIEMKDQDFINRIYFARNIGEVKRESIMKTENEEDFIVTSTLTSISE